MLFRDAFKTSTRALAHGKMRSLLTMLGIVIGIASVIIVMSLGASAEYYIVGQVQSFGSDLISINPGVPVAGGAPAQAAGVVIKTLVKQDVNSISKEPSVKLVSANVTGQATIIYGNKSKSVLWSATDPSMFKMINLSFQSGHPFTDADLNSYNKVIILGSQLAKDLFGNVSPLGKYVRLKDFNFLVTGVLDPKGAGIFSFDNYAVIPLTVGQKQILGVDYYQEVDVKSDPAYTTGFVKERIISVLRQNHHITDPAKDDFTVQSMEDALKTLGNITSILTLFLSAIAAISLIVGGIGIMNIMLVSVTERTKEIGLRKAVGATDRDILKQFLIESVLLTFTGGIIGIAIGAAVVGLAYFALTRFFSIAWVFAFPPGAVGLALFVSAGAGIAFGIYPARKAGKKNPIDALRYE